MFIQDRLNQSSRLLINELLVMLSRDSGYFYLSVPLPLVNLEVQVGQDFLSQCYIHEIQL